LAKSCPGPLPALGKTRRIIANRLGSVNRTIPAFFLLLLLGAGLAGQQQSPPAAAPSPREFYTEPELIEVLKGIFAHTLGDPSEKLVFITDDGQIIIIGNRNPKGVTTTIYDIIIALAHKGQHLGKVTNIIHNHERNVGFNETDIAACKTLRKAGFKGKFQIYHPVSWRIKTLAR
jgi:hypothetical protein